MFCVFTPSIPARLDTVPVKKDKTKTPQQLLGNTIRCLFLGV